MINAHKSLKYKGNKSKKITKNDTNYQKIRALKAQDIVVMKDDKHKILWN